MKLFRRAKYYIDDNIILVTAKGGNKRTGAGGVVNKSQNALVCVTCFALIPSNFLIQHTNTHFQTPKIGGNK
jgi:hypothetical protein